MRDTTKKQLEQCRYADLSNYDSVTNTYHIPKYTKPTYDVGKYYLVKLSQILVNNNNSVLAANWNHCTSPSTDYLKIVVNKQLGKNILVDGLAFDPVTNSDLNSMWSGWLPIDELTQISKL